MLLSQLLIPEFRFVPTNIIKYTSMSAKELLRIILKELFQFGAFGFMTYQRMTIEELTYIIIRLKLSKSKKVLNTQFHHLHDCT